MDWNERDGEGIGGREKLLQAKQPRRSVKNESC